MEASLNGPSGNISLTASVLTMGRAADNLLVLPDPQSSSHHAEVRPGAQGYAIVDLNSTNGTFVNEQRLPSQVARPLIPGDVIRIGTTRFSYEVAGSYDATMRAGATDFNPDAYQPTVSAQPPSAPSPGFAPPNPAPQPGYQQQYQSYPDYPAYQSQQPQPPSGYGAYGQGQANQSYQQPPSSYAPDYQQQQYPAQAPQNYPLQQGAFQQQWGAAPGQMGAPALPVAPPKKKSRTGLVIALSVLLLVLVGGGIGGYLILRSTPEKTLQAFCTALINSDAQGVYNQLSAHQQGQTSVSQISTGLHQDALLGGFKTCTYNSVQQNGSAYTANLDITLGSTSVPAGTTKATLIDENGTWKIDNLQSQSTPPVQ